MEEELIKDLIEALDRAIMLAQENINNNFHVEFMNKIIENYELAKKQVIESNKTMHITGTGGSRAYLHSYFCGELSDTEEKLLKLMDMVDERIKRLIIHNKKYNDSNVDEKSISKDDFLNSYYNKKN